MPPSAPTLFEDLKAHCADDWERYIQHPFVRGLGDGSLPRECFQHYLKQDYLFLIHFARCYALAIYKSPSLLDMREAKKGLDAILDDEMALHVNYCRDWGIAREELEGLPEARANMAYTRYVLERGQAGTLLDLYCALAPCAIGYAEVAAWLTQQSWTLRQDNPYQSWIDAYASEDYQASAEAMKGTMTRLAERELTDSRFEDLAATFHDATRLEISFWEMGLTLAD